MNGGMVITEWTSVQAGALACVACGADYLRSAVSHVPVGRSINGSQVLACVGCCPDDVRRAAGGVLR